MRLVSLLAVLLLAPAANASTITVSLTGTVTSVDAAIASAFTVGDAVSGSFQFDGQAVDTEPDSAIGEYYPALTSLSISFGSYSASLGPDGGEIFTNLHGFSMLSSAIGADVAGFSLARFPIEMVLSNTSDVFPDDAIPSQVDLAAFATRSITLQFIDGNVGYLVQASVDSLAYTVPEPGALGLLGLGGLLPAVRRRRSQEPERHDR